MVKHPKSLLSLVYKFKTNFKIMFIQKFVEVPNTNIKEEVTNDFGFDLCYDMAQQFGHAQLVWYALNGNRVVEGEYTDKD